MSLYLSSWMTFGNTLSHVMLIASIFNSFSIYLNCAISFWCSYKNYYSGVKENESEEEDDYEDGDGEREGWDEWDD